MIGEVEEDHLPEMYILVTEVTINPRPPGDVHHQEINMDLHIIGVEEDRHIHHLDVLLLLVGPTIDPPHQDIGAKDNLHRHVEVGHQTDTHGQQLIKGPEVHHLEGDRQRHQREKEDQPHPQEDQHQCSGVLRKE